MYDIQTQQADVAAQIVDTQQQVDEAQAKYDAAMDTLKKQAVQNYTSDQVDYISVLLSSSSFSDFATRIYLVEKMMSQQTTAIDNVIAAKEELDTKQADLQSQKDNLDSLETAAQSKQTSIQTTVDEQSAYIAGLSSELTSLMAQQASERSAAAAAAVAAAATTTASGSSSSSSASPSSSGSSTGSYSSAYAAAESRLGCSYVPGASGPSSFDCSSLVTWAYQQMGINLPHSSSAQYSYCAHISRSELQAGDLVFYTDGSAPITHVALYIGSGYVIEALSPSQGVCEDAIDWNNLDIVGYGRV